MGGIGDFDIFTPRLRQKLSKETILSANPQLRQVFALKHFRFDELLVDQR